jgi:hypothetical protein
MLANTGLYIDEVALWVSKKIADWNFHFSSSNCLALNATRPPTSQMPMENLMHWNKSSMCKWYVNHPEEIICSEAQHIHIINKKTVVFYSQFSICSQLLQAWSEVQQCYKPTWSFHARQASDSLRTKFITSTGFINVHGSSSRTVVIYQWRKVVCLFCFVCTYEIYRTGMLHIAVLVPLESSWGGGVHGLSSMAFWLAVQKFLNIERFLHWKSN